MRETEGGQKLAGYGVVLDEPVVRRSPYRSLIETQGIHVASFDAGEFSRNERMLVREARRTMGGPAFQRIDIGLALGAPFHLATGLALRIAGGDGERFVHAVAHRLDMTF